MRERSTPNMLVYRDGRRRVCAGVLVRDLETALASLAQCTNHSTDEAMLGALLRAGELECALWDADSDSGESAAAITDQLASILCRSRTSCAPEFASLSKAQQLLAGLDHMGELTVSRPEGFAYYALHPLDFADLVSESNLCAGSAHVVGLRTIGTTLSAVATAKLNASGIPASRTTVRPTGHPYDRRTAFTESQRAVIRQALSRDSIFLVCDEGPGRSGSSMLSVAAALEGEGVSCERIILLCSHQPDVEKLCAPRGPERWRRYRSLASGMTKRLPAHAAQYLGADEWREVFIPGGEPWPGAWPHMERLKFLSPDQQRLYKFEGHGPYGEAVQHRDRVLSANGFGVPYIATELGFGIHQVVRGRQPHIADVCPGLLRHMARYCAFRADAFPAAACENGVHDLENMATVNLEQEWGFAPDLHLEVARPAICDGRMQPFKWCDLGGEQWIKLDASTHGDDHFFPGPTDVAWDLAGICVEWRLSSACRQLFLAEYQRLSGDNPTRRFWAYEIAYTAFRLGWSRMAASSVPDTPDEDRLEQEAGYHRAALDHLLQVNVALD